MFWRPWWLLPHLCLLSCGDLDCQEKELSSFQAARGSRLESSTVVRSWDFMVDEELPASRASSGSLQLNCHGDVVSLPWWGKSIHGFRWNYTTHRGRDELGVPSQFSEAAAAILLAASENSERGGKGVGRERLGLVSSAGFIFHSCKLNNLKNSPSKIMVHKFGATLMTFSLKGQVHLVLGLWFSGAYLKGKKVMTSQCWSRKLEYALLMEIFIRWTSRDGNKS